jgi:Leucine-rich repeat (LRR) protein
MSNNALTVFPELALSLTNLSWLSLQGNKIKKLPKAFFSNQTLYFLDISNTPVAKKMKTKKREKLSNSAPQMYILFDAYNE